MQLGRGILIRNSPFFHCVCLSDVFHLRIPRRRDPFRAFRSTLMRPPSLARSRTEPGKSKQYFFQTIIWSYHKFESGIAKLWKRGDNCSLYFKGSLFRPWYTIRAHVKRRWSQVMTEQWTYHLHWSQKRANVDNGSTHWISDPLRSSLSMPPGHWLCSPVALRKVWWLQQRMFMNVHGTVHSHEFPWWEKPR